MINRQSKEEIIFSSDAADIIQDLIKKYALDNEQKEKIKKLTDTKDGVEKEAIFDDLPSRKMAKIVKEKAEGGITDENFASEIQNRFGLSKEKSGSLSEELKERILVLAKRVPIVEEVGAAPLIKSGEPQEPTLPKIIKEAEIEKPKKPPQKPDIYRESI